LVPKSNSPRARPPSERGVAPVAIKGLSIAETGRLRESAEGTVKSQLGPVYRKAGVSGRGALLGMLVDELVTHLWSQPMLAMHRCRPDEDHCTAAPAGAYRRDHPAATAPPMTNQIAIFLGALILIGLGIDWHYFGWDGTLFLARRLMELIEWLKFWR